MALYSSQVGLLRRETPVTWNHKASDKVGTPRKTDLTESLKWHICTKKKTTNKPSPSPLPTRLTLLFFAVFEGTS